MTSWRVQTSYVGSLQPILRLGRKLFTSWLCGRHPKYFAPCVRMVTTDIIMHSGHYRCADLQKRTPWLDLGAKTSPVFLTPLVPLVFQGCMSEDNTQVLTKSISLPGRVLACGRVTTGRYLERSGLTYEAQVDSF